MFGGLEWRIAGAIGVLAMLYGGRRERPAGLLLAAYDVLFIFAMHAERTLISTTAFVLSVTGGLALLSAWLATRSRNGWLIGFAGLQALTFAGWITILAAYELSRPALNHDLYPMLRLPLFGIALARDLCLLWAVAARWLGPPAAPPPEIQPEAV